MENVEKLVQELGEKEPGLIMPFFKGLSDSDKVFYLALFFHKLLQDERKYRKMQFYAILAILTFLAGVPALIPQVGG